MELSYQVKKNITNTRIDLKMFGNDSQPKFMKIVMGFEELKGV